MEPEVRVKELVQNYNNNTTDLELRVYIDLFRSFLYERVVTYSGRSCVLSHHVKYMSHNP